MKTLIAGVALGLLGLQATAARGADAEPDRVERALVGSWKHIGANFPDGIVQVKHVTPTHWTWVIYDVKSKGALASAGGTWSVAGDRYKERIEFASDTHAHLRGKEYTFTIKLAGDRWAIKVSPDADIAVDDVWERMKGKP